MSVIQGPPGTRKTFTASVIATDFQICDSQTVVLTAPSNFAADGFARKVAQARNMVKVQKLILKINSHSREDYIITPDLDAANLGMHY